MRHSAMRTIAMRIGFKTLCLASAASILLAPLSLAHMARPEAVTRALLNDTTLEVIARFGPDVFPCHLART